MMTIMNLIETIVKKGKDFIDTITLTRKLRISRDEHLLFLEKHLIEYENRMQEYLKLGNFSSAENMYNAIISTKANIEKANNFWEYINKDNK